MPAQGGPDDKLKLFISYSRRDMAAADALVLALEGAGFETMIDRRDLPYGEEWQKELADFIRASDTVLWLVSPNSVASKWCNWELGEVGRLNKRLVPVRIAAVAPQQLPESLGKIHILPAEGVYDQSANFPALATTLKTDRVWVKEATRLADRAREWLARERSGDQLLRGAALKAAEAWSTRRPRAAPQPHSDVLELVLASRKGAVRRQRWAIGGSLAVAAGALMLAVFALTQWLRAERELTVATAQKLAAESQAVLAQANEAGRPGAPDPQRSVLLALESMRALPSVEADRVLREGLRRISARPPDPLLSDGASPPPSALEVTLEDGYELRALGPGASWIGLVIEGNARVYDTAKRAIRPANDHEAKLIEMEPSSEPEVERALPTSPDGRYRLVKIEQDPPRDWIFAQLGILRAADNSRLAVLPLEWHVRDSVFRRDSSQLATVTGVASMDAAEPSATRLVGSTVSVWSIPGGEKQAEVSFAQLGGIRAMAVDGDGDWLAVQVLGPSTEGQGTTTIVVMPIWPDLVRKEACRRLTRNLSPSEWTSYVGGRQLETCPGLPMTSE